MKINNNIPAYRFQGYTDAWKQRKLGEVVTRVTRKNSELLTELALTISAQHGLIDQTEFFDKRIASKDVSGYYLLKNGEFAYNKSTSYDAPWGAVKRLDRYDMGVLSTLYIVFGISNPERVSSNFLVTYFDTNLWHREVQAVAAEGARNHGLLNISANDFLDIALFFPKSFSEQEAIGTFFSTLDQQITLHQRKLDTLKEQKKTYLKLLFPAKGQTKPALRFQGFEDDWEEVKLGEVLVEYNKKSEIENQFELLSSTNSGIEPRSGRVSGESNIGYKIIKRGMVVLSPQNLWLGNINYNAKFEIGIVSPSYKVFNIYGPNELFLATVLRLPQMFFEYAQASVQGASIVRRNLDLDLFGSILVPLPTLPEQEAIGTFFQTLDQEIVQVEDKLASLKEMKKTLLRKLFV
ncbi:restriction endonuclease subunit S [Streptococcus suis]|uniref:Type I restriction enzyme, S subunit n=1 Tax=Streptococcus suis TaxID=1307 RepID=A0A123SW69_STRSU|nr:restriction endonuclease subunit S [Streptococcus suis]NQH78297.1 restriction endonuclease subunit S [Streptococcus suis]CYU62357.1 type I restriction enzyme%2C S subunit [Streptococcus suis]